MKMIKTLMITTALAFAFCGCARNNVANTIAEYVVSKDGMFKSIDGTTKKVEVLRIRTTGYGMIEVYMRDKENQRHYHSVTIDPTRLELVEY